MNTADDAVPVGDDEFVLRRIPAVYFNASLPIPIQPEAFRPTGNDTAGLSVLRERFARAEDTLLVVATGKRHLYYVARLAISELKKLNLTVVPDPRPPVPGHALIPQLNTNDYQTNKIAWKEVQRQLAEIASRDIVLRPGG